MVLLFQIVSGIFVLHYKPKVVALLITAQNNCRVTFLFITTISNLPSLHFSFSAFGFIQVCTERCTESGIKIAVSHSSVSSQMIRIQVNRGERPNSQHSHMGI